MYSMAWKQTATAFLHHRQWLPTRRSVRFLPSDSLTASRWNVGDRVQLRNNTISRNQHQVAAEQVVGTIQQVRGSGWYTVQLAAEPVSVIKVRGTQLLSVEEGTGLNKSRTTSNDNNGVFCPPPTIHDLDALLLDPPESADGTMIRQLRHFSSYQRWIALTDLHCASSTLSTCLEVLQMTHTFALERNAGIVFLGDFWHQRAVLRVDCLNAVLQCLSSWQVPMIMIPGNHDQITLRGHDHSLTPLENAYRLSNLDDNDSDSVSGLLILSHPTKFLDALFVPHIREPAILESVIQSPAALASKALLLHADVTGAYMNDMIQSQGGVPPSMFPSGMTIYSGHFHKPHIVSNEASGVQIEYLGSPYQVSMAEAHQNKALAVLDSNAGWQCVERLPMDVGRRHFHVRDKPELMQLAVSDALWLLKSATDAIMVRAGDRVVCSSAKGKGDQRDSDVEERIRVLREYGVAVEIRELKSEYSSMGQNAGGLTEEDLSPMTLWAAYLQNEARRGTMDQETSQELQIAGNDLLHTVIEGQNGLCITAFQQSIELRLDSVTLEGFGPFASKQTYPLCKRGLVLLRGSNQDGGADSNGSGKSMLAMSTLWCLTGSLDARPLNDAKVSDVINDLCKTARVTVQGEINGHEFSLSRSKSSSKSGLVFLLNGSDLSAQSAKETQSIFEETLGVNSAVLARTIFHGQHSIDDLLEATDSRLKEELSLIVPLPIWREATVTSRKLAKDASKRVDELAGMLAVRECDLVKLKESCAATKEELEQKKVEYEDKYFRFQEEFGAAQSDYSNLSELKHVLEQAKRSILEREATMSNHKIRRDIELHQLYHDQKEHRLAKAMVEDRLQTVTRQHDSSAAVAEAAKARVRNLESVWKLDLSGGLHHFETPASCPTCRQSLSDHRARSETHASVSADAVSALTALELAESDLNATKPIIESVMLQHQQLSAISMQSEEAVVRMEAHWREVIQRDEKELAIARGAFDQAVAELSSAAINMQKNARIDELRVVVDQSKAIHLAAQDTFVSLFAELKEYEKLVEKLELEKSALREVESTMLSLSTAFGPRGIQAFVLQNAVSSLQSAAQLYLNDLSDGSQRLQLTLETDDRISRRAFVRDADGSYRERALASLSGGQWRRCSLALSLGFSDLVSRRGQLRPSMCIFDEPLTHLDRTGRSNVGNLLQSMLHQKESEITTVIVILQDLTAEELEESFDCIDEVVKQNGQSSVYVDGVTSKSKSQGPLFDTNGKVLHKL